MSRLQVRSVSLRSRIAIVVVAIAGMAAIAGGLYVSQPAGAGTTLLEAAQPFLSADDHTQFTPLPDGAAAAVSQQQAENVAFQNGWGAPEMNPTATLVSATVDGYCNSQPNGACVPIISSRQVWIVMIPDQQVPLSSAPGSTSQDSITGSVAVLVDANTGAYLMADVIPGS